MEIIDIQEVSTGSFLGRYEQNKNNIIIKINIKEKHNIIHTVLHELGHYVWYNIYAEIEKKEFIEEYDKMGITHIIENGNIIKSIDKEYFAELFAYNCFNEEYKQKNIMKFRLDPSSELNNYYIDTKKIFKENEILRNTLFYYFSKKYGIN